MSRKFSTLLLLVTLVVIGLQTMSINLRPGQLARKPDTLLNRIESADKVAGVAPETPAPQSPGPDLPVPLTPIEDQEVQQLVLEHQKAKIPATPADPYSYALSWEQELAKIKGIKDPVVVIWQKRLYLAYHNNNVLDTNVKTEVANRVKFLEPRFDKIFISTKPSTRRTLLQAQEMMKAGKSPEEYVLKLEAKFKR